MCHPPGQKDFLYREVGVIHAIGEVIITGFMVHLGFWNSHNTIPDYSTRKYDWII